MSEVATRAKRMQHFIFSVDRNGLLWLTDFRHPHLNRAMEVASRMGDWDAWTATLLGFLVPIGPFKATRRRAARAALPRILLALGICFAVKKVARRARPSVAVEGFSTLLSDPDPYSFPSSHAATSWAAYLGIANELGGLAWLLTVPAVLTSYSRLHVGAHYPLDVLIGTGIGVTIGLT
ncbi:MAG: phosphatase PAP2 family protein [Deltaproteobacteria bacterium]|nr:phosphatase PAP2 family protein [Deltaproteobacteria bacterium]